MTERIRFRSGYAIVYLLMGAGLAVAALAPGILFIELYEWLTSSEWPGLTLADGLALFGVHHAQAETDAQRLIDLALALPLSLALFFTGVSSFLAGVSLGDWRDERRLMAELRDSSPFYWLTLISATDVKMPTLIRLLLLVVILRLIAIIGAIFLAADGVLLLMGVPLGWLGAAGVALLAGAWLTDRIRERKLGGYGQAGG